LSKKLNDRETTEAVFIANVISEYAALVLPFIG
jgi:hypothetical protein